MTDNLNVTAGSGSTIGMDEVTDATLGTVKVGFGKIMDGTLDSTNKWIINSSGEGKVTPTANSTVDVNKLAGTTTDTNSGTKSAGTLRVVLATDQPALTNKILVTPDSVALPANQSVNISQINAVTPLMGNGASGTGAQRVTLANDSTGKLAAVDTITNVVHVDDNSGSLTVDYATTGSGTATGALRVELPTNGTGVVGLAAGSAVIGHVITDATSVTAATLSAETTKVIGTVNIAASQTIAVTNTGTFATQDTLSAETTKVIGTVRTADGSGNLYTSNSTTYTAKNAQDTNLLGTLGTAFSTAGKVDVKGADGDVFVRNANAANFLANVTLQTQTDTIMVGGVNIKEINAVTPLMGNGTTGTGSLRVTIASDNTANSNPWLTTQSPATSGGLSVFNASSGKNATALTNSAQAIKASAGQLYGYFIYNPNTVVAYVQIFNIAAASVTLATSTDFITLAIPPLTAANWSDPNGIAFGTAMSAAATTTGSGNSALTTALDANFYYK